MVGPFLFYLKPRRALKMAFSAAFIWVSIYGAMIGLGYKPLGYSRHFLKNGEAARRFTRFWKA